MGLCHCVQTGPTYTIFTMPQVELSMSVEQTERFSRRAKDNGYDNLAQYVMTLLEAEERQSQELESLLEQRLEDPRPSIEYKPGLVQQWGKDWSEARANRTAG